jgi:hypothetical protein
MSADLPRSFVIGTTCAVGVFAFGRAVLHIKCVRFSARSAEDRTPGTLWVKGLPPSRPPDEKATAYVL